MCWEGRVIVHVNSSSVQIGEGREEGRVGGKYGEGGRERERWIEGGRGSLTDRGKCSSQGVSSLSV